MARVKAVIFDLDGTLTDTLPLCFAAFADALAGLGPNSLTENELTAMYGPSEEGILRRLVPDRWEECSEAYLAFYLREHASLAKVFPGVHSLLGDLKDRGVRVGIVTGKGPRSTLITVQQFGLEAYLDALEWGSPEGSRKPEALAELLHRWSLSGREVAYVGDAPNDMEASLSAGTIPLGAGWAPSTDPRALRSAGALEVFASPGSLKEWLAG